jgi:hypothetical protein
LAADSADHHRHRHHHHDKHWRQERIRRYRRYALHRLPHMLTSASCLCCTPYSSHVVPTYTPVTVPPIPLAYMSCCSLHVCTSLDASSDQSPTYQHQHCTTSHAPLCHCRPSCPSSPVQVRPRHPLSPAYVR